MATKKITFLNVFRKKMNIQFKFLYHNLVNTLILNNSAEIRFEVQKQFKTHIEPITSNNNLVQKYCLIFSTN